MSFQVEISEAEKIADQLERAFEGDAWHGPSLSEILTDVSAEEASNHPIPAAHSIWEIVLHAAAWQRAVRERLRGRPLTSLPDEEDWPPIEEPTEEAWTEAVQTLRAEYSELRQAILQCRDCDLVELTTSPRYTAYQELHGVIQHILYHAGQIVMLKKAAAGGS
jgi:uncharacterized damage-inducible protein DinB